MSKKGEIIAFKTKKVLKDTLERYAKSIGLTPSVVCRVALVKYLQEKGIITNEKTF